MEPTILNYRKPGSKPPLYEPSAETAVGRGLILGGKTESWTVGGPKDMAWLVSRSLYASFVRPDLN